MSDGKEHKKIVIDGSEAAPLPKTTVPFYINWQSVVRKKQKENLEKLLAEIPKEKIIE